MNNITRRSLAGLTATAAALGIGISAANAATPQPATKHTTATAPARYTAVQVTDNVVRAWGMGNRAEAAKWMTTPAADALFRLQAKGGPGWTRVSATSAKGMTVVVYKNAKGSTLKLTVMNSRLATSTHAVQYVYLWRR